MPPAASFSPERTLKRDLLGVIEVGTADGRAAIRRSWRVAALWVRPLAWVLARREKAALEALSGLDGVPALLSFGDGVLVRSFLEGTTVDEARPKEPAYYARARKLLRAIHRRGVTHNDTHKEQNWLVTCGGMPALVDFQLASRHRRHGGWFRLCRAEDVRHLLKHKRTHCPGALSTRERRLLARKSWPARLWRATVKPVYLFVTRRLLLWRDREGRG